MSASLKQNTEVRVVEFISDGLTIRGCLRLPTRTRQCPLVVLGHGFGGLKEWTLPEIVGALVEAGIAGLWFDYRNFGDSDGEPRDEVAHYGRLEDWKNAISYATSLPEIDPHRIGIWGTSLGGRDVLAVAAIDRRVKAVVAQTPLIKWTAKEAARMAGFGDCIERFQQELGEDHQNRALGQRPRYLPFVKASGDDAKSEYLRSLSADALQNYSNRLTLQSYQPTALTDVVPLVGMIAPTPLLFIIAKEDSLPGQLEAYRAAQDPKGLVYIEGGHFSAYTVSKRDSIEATKKWFTEYLI